MFHPEPVHDLQNAFMIDHTHWPHHDPHPPFTDNACVPSNPPSGCAHTVDIGEASYSSVLVDDLDGDGALQLLVSTMNGNVYCLDTRTPYHPLKTWTAQVQGLNGQVARWNHFGIYAGLVSRQPRDVAGQKLQVRVWSGGWDVCLLCVQ